MTDKTPISPEEKKNNHSEFHFMEPDYDREIFQIPPESKQKILNRLAFLYGEPTANACYGELERIMRVYYAYKTPRMIQMEKSFNPHERFTEKDVILITYGDLIQADDEKPLQILTDFTKYLKEAINTLHILPFFPYSSDRGFSVTDFEEVDPRLGTWEDILELKSSVKLMFDGVFNHISSKSRWFQEFLDGNPEFQEFFIVFSTKSAIPEEYLSLILRPRTSELLSTFSTLDGKRSVWTTFSRDQIDLNFKNPQVLLKMAQILLLYVRRGADHIRLDAITYLWHELGTSCAHLAQTHTVIKLFRDILDTVAPHVALISETNVPHEDNIQYFGNGHDEAQMVYNFALPPLVLHTFQTGSSTALTQWAMGLDRVSDSATYFNILDSHDGIGVLGAKNILTDQEIEMMALRVVEHGGFISFKDNGDGTASPYELNTTWYSALNREDCDEPLDFKIKRFLASRSIALALMGVPGIYLHGLFGSENDAEAVLDEGQTRSISRRSFDRDTLYQTLDDPNTATHKIAYGFGDMILKRTREKAFHPNAAQLILSISSAVFAVLRTSVDQTERILCITNVTAHEQSITVDLLALDSHSASWMDILTNQPFRAKENVLTIRLSPYEVVWLEMGSDG